jgi:hypothetical protein
MIVAPPSISVRAVQEVRDHGVVRPAEVALVSTRHPARGNRLLPVCHGSEGAVNAIAPLLIISCTAQVETNTKRGTPASKAAWKSCR